jgi:hypothetical protein
MTTMRQTTCRPFKGVFHSWLCLVAVALLTIAPAGAQSTAADAQRILKGASDYLAAQKSIALTFDSDIEIVTKDLQKIQFASSGDILLSRPNGLRLHRVGGYSEAELVFDGRLATIYGASIKAYAQADAPGTVEQFIDALRDRYGIAAPFADLAVSNVYQALMGDVLDAKYIGRGVIDGMECEHLAFRNEDTDWQIWIQIAPNPIPRKYVITTKGLTGAPQYTLRIKDWKAGVAVAADAFTFTPPADAKKAEISEMSRIDEVPLTVTP